MSTSEEKSSNSLVKLAVLDLAGTTVDYGSCAPAQAFVQVFKEQGIDITMAQAREPMGLQKLDHIRAISKMPSIAQQWLQVKGHPFDDKDVEKLYKAFQPIHLKAIPSYNQLIPGTLAVAESFRNMGIKIAINSGYDKQILDIVLGGMKEQGFCPDFAICASEVPAGRPAPWMLLRTMEILNSYPPASVVHIGDTLSDVQCGLNAGVWSVGVTMTGNMIGLPFDAVEALSGEELANKLHAAKTKMISSGAHYVVSGIAGCIAVIEEINQRLIRGDRPWYGLEV
ncbi:MAG: phosphonoacetaldehyde hydrolase [bacterium]